ncbi:uncharacterized protein LOC112574117 [Pomacea canaliculata]|nr:uncharacterized protein LOC112574117 [Pomacea canaliculata]XP_025110789.1 uncharacterized protein LOC112574117 [Pomacea canaliculata]
MDRRLLAAVVIVTMLSSILVLSHPQSREERGYPPGQGVCQAPGKVPGSTPGGSNFIPSRVIGLILNERCQEWRRLNRRPPAFCVNAAATGAAATAKVSDTTLCDNYRQYWGLVSDDERRRDHDNVRRKHGSWD